MPLSEQFKAPLLSMLGSAGMYGMLAALVLDQPTPALILEMLLVGVGTAVAVWHQRRSK